MKLLSALNINRIATKIWFMLIASIFGIVFLVAAFYFLGQRTNSALMQIHEKGFIILDNVRAMQLVSRTFTRDLYENVNDPIGTGLVLKDSLTELETLWHEIARVGSNEVQQEEFRQIFTVFKAHSIEYQKAGQDPKTSNLSEFHKRWKMSLQRLIGFLDQMAEHQKGNTYQVYVTEKLYQERAVNIVIIASAIGGLIFAILSIWNITLITKPLVKVVDMINELGRGKFSARSNLTGQDEISQVGQTLDAMAQTLSEMFNIFIQNAKVLSESSEEVSTSTTQIEQATENIARNANQEVDLLNMSRNLILNISESVNETTTEIMDLQKIATRAEKETEVVTESISKVDRSMALIQESGIQIEDIVGVITDISNRTNLLSLNAAIEAAKAGDFGKGFAVVADEVGKLAEKSATSVIEIQELIETSTRNIQEGTQVIQDTRKILQGIIKLVQQISTMTNEAAAKLTEQNRGITEIAHSAEGVVSISELNSSSAHELSGTVKQIARTMETLSKMADKVNDQLAAYSV